ncbi:MAG: trypsin-like peptidase domain-containing protein [Leptospiraceae bacterium]|nr:trypsin-like peptidase domain-containing protein [Leptospiraceae bacterium]MCP5510880.1 trypsin-like peptidase domain-containing protein [Leptospiraceae bacterium]
MAKMNVYFKFLSIFFFILACNPTPNSMKKVLNKLQKSVVAISINEAGKEKEWIASGFYISKSGHILTCAHPFYGKENVRTSKSDEILPIVAESKRLDLVLLKSNSGGEDWISTEDFEEGEYGESVYSMGSPYGEKESFFTAIVSKPYAFGGDPTEPDLQYLQVDKVFLPGFSGAPILNTRGKFLGVARHQRVLLESKQSGLGYAIRPEVVKVFLEKYMKEE